MFSSFSFKKHENDVLSNL